MPGIVGLITDMPHERAKDELIRMVAAIRHESFYRTGMWIDQSMGIYVGWAVQENSFSDGMPLSNERGDRVLVFSGEEYPEPGTATDLKRRGHALEPEGPSYLVHLSEEDARFPAGLNGRFHGLLVERMHGTATLFNDRYGMHRLYYHESEKSFYFATESKAILKVRAELRNTDLRSLGEFVTCGCVLQDRTLFEAIHVLPPASAWVFRNRLIDKRGVYFQPREWEEQEPLEPQEYSRLIQEVFSRNLPRYFNGSNRIGMSLTGGMDTRAVMAWQTFPPGSLPCYTFGGVYRDCRDVVVARQVAKVCGQPHQVISVANQFLSEFPYYAERSLYLSDGCVDLSRSPDLYLNQKVRGIAPVRMTGLYGDEVLRHLRTFKPVRPATGLFSPDFLPYVDQADNTYVEVTREHPLSFAAFRQGPWSHHGSLALEESQVTMRTPFLDNSLVQTAFRAPKGAFTNNGVRLQLIREGNSALRRIPTDLGFDGDRGRLSAAASQIFQKFTYKAEYAYDYGMPQWLARIDHSLSPFHLEQLFLGRHKLCHFRVWYRDVLSSYVQEILLDSRTLARPYLQRHGVQEIVRRHLNGTGNYTREINKLLTLEHLQRLFFDRQ
jgi:asparagine synthase (glutamine-hydrolysing)